MIGGFVAGLFLGMACTGVLAWRIHRRMCFRIMRHREMEKLSRELEIRRDRLEFGIVDETPPGAGPSASEFSLFPMRPGALHLSHLEETNRPKIVDIDQISATLDHASGSDTQNIAPKER